MDQGPGYFVAQRNELKIGCPLTISLDHAQSPITTSVSKIIRSRDARHQNLIITLLSLYLMAFVSAVMHAVYCIVLKKALVAETLTSVYFNITEYRQPSLRGGRAILLFAKDKG